MDALQLLKEDHDRIKTLLGRARSAGNAKLLFREAKVELARHSHIEETVFYRVIENHGNLRELVAQAYEEHCALKRLLEKMESEQESEFANSLGSLAAEIDLHFSREENEVFARVRGLGLDLAQLGGELEAEKINYDQWASKRIAGI